jgi:hypothetical protein
VDSDRLTVALDGIERFAQLFDALGEHEAAKQARAVVFHYREAAKAMAACISLFPAAKRVFTDHPDNYPCLAATLQEQENSNDRSHS